LRAVDHTAEVRDLYAEDFAPTMSADERLREAGGLDPLLMNIRRTGV
jgi:hypothetical protein